jgi:hypothetical protein
VRCERTQEGRNARRNDKENTGEDNAYGRRDESAREETNEAGDDQNNGERDESANDAPHACGPHGHRGAARVGRQIRDAADC